MALVYPVITMRDDIHHPGSRLELMGVEPDDEQIRHYSLEERVDADTPPTFLLHAIDDPAVKVENSLVFLTRCAVLAYRWKCICLSEENTGLAFVIRRDCRSRSGRN